MLALPMNLRPIRWPADAAQLQRFDASYRTTTILLPEIVGLCASLRAVELARPFCKTYPHESLVEAVTSAAFTVAATSEHGAIDGFAAVKLAPWNRSAELTALFVAPDRRGRGVGRALLAAALDFARGEQARCLAVETQSCNVPAIRFYQRAGFRFCGLHTALYDPETVAPEEVAVFFTRSLTDP
jgi:ribosomal protein S18 acetylase RimI-like enzyme